MSRAAPLCLLSMTELQLCSLAQSLSPSPQSLALAQLSSLASASLLHHSFSSPNAPVPCHCSF